MNIFLEPATITRAVSRQLFQKTTWIVPRQLLADLTRYFIEIYQQVSFDKLMPQHYFKQKLKSNEIKSKKNQVHKNLHYILTHGHPPYHMLLSHHIAQSSQPPHMATCHTTGSCHIIQQDSINPSGVYIMFQILFSSCRPKFISFLIIKIFYAYYQGYLNTIDINIESKSLNIRKKTLIFLAQYTIF